MTFAWPHLLWLLVVPLALLAWDLSRRRRTAANTHPKILRAEAGARALRLSEQQNVPTASRAATPRVWLCLGLAFAILALARPQWGRLEEPVFDQSREILLAVDLSRSMLTPDVKPSRLDRAKLLIQALLEKLEGERVGLVVFAGTAFLQSPLSADYEILREFLPALGPEFLPQGGSNYGALLEASIQAFSATNSADRFLVILSDGEATDDEWRGQIAELKKKSIRVLGLGVGTPEGAMIPDGSGGLVKDDRGAVVMSKLESATLQELARETNGVYRDASGWVDLAGLVNETIEAGRKGQFVEKNTIRLAERFQWPLAFALWFLLVSLCYEFPVRPRVRDLKLPVAPPSPGSQTSDTVKKAVTTAALVVLSCGLLLPTPGFAAAKLAQPPSTPSASAPAAEQSSLAKIIGRLSSADAPTGRDWAELARETVTWGSRLQSAQQPIPEGPVRDGLAAVELGSKLDPKTADWPKLREELEALLEKKDEEKKDDQQNQQDQQDQNQQQQQQQKQDQQKQDQKQQNQPQNQQDKQNQDAQKNEQSSESPEQQKKDEQKKQDGESAFGDMNKKEEPPPPPQPEPQENMQKVGGAEKPAEEQKVDPALALPLQKLDQLRNQDSPAQLFQMMEGEKKPTKKPTKDW